jgi:hypothetical protein
MGDPTSSYARAGIALRVSGALKSHHHDKVKTPSVGNFTNINYVKFTVSEINWQMLIREVSASHHGNG